MCTILPLLTFGVGPLTVEAAIAERRVAIVVVIVDIVVCRCLKQGLDFVNFSCKLSLEGGKIVLRRVFLLTFRLRLLLFTFLGPRSQSL